MRFKTAGREDFTLSKASNFKDMLWVMNNFILKMEPPDPNWTEFRLDEREIFQNLLYQIRRDCPNIPKEELIQRIGHG